MSTFSKRVSANNDDGYLAGSWSASGSTTRVGRAFLGNQIISAWRWTSVTIPQGATINSATLTLIVDSTVTASIGSSIKGIDEDNTSDFSSDPTGRATTTVGHPFSVVNPTGGNSKVITITEAIQEIIDRVGWASGNALGLLTDDDTTSNDNIIDFKSYEGDSTKAALLDVDYTSGTTTSTTTTSTTTTSTSTTTTSTSTTTVPDFYGVKVFKPGVAENTLSPKNFFINSKYKLLKIHKQGSFKMTFIGNGSSGGEASDVTIQFPELNLRPFILVYAQRMKHDASIDTDFHLLDWSYFGATISGNQIAKVYNNKIVISYYDEDSSLDSVGVTSLYGYYYIFKEEV
jgi:hypothetical protein